MAFPPGYQNRHSGSSAPTRSRQRWNSIRFGAACQLNGTRQGWCVPSRVPTYFPCDTECWRSQDHSQGSRESNRRRYPQRLCICHHSKSWPEFPARAASRWWTRRKSRMGWAALIVKLRREKTYVAEGATIVTLTVLDGTHVVADRAGAGLAT